MTVSHTRRPNRSPIWGTLLVSFGCLLLGSCSIAVWQNTYTAGEGTFEKSVLVDGPISLDAFTASGDIDVRPGGPGDVRVIGHVRIYRGWWGGNTISAADALARLQQNPPVELNGKVVKVGYLTDPDLNRNVGISYEVRVPANTSVVAHISSGSAVVEGIQSSVEAATASGHVTLANIKGQVHASSTSGGVDLNSIGGAATVLVSSGSIVGSGLVATNARTMSGTVTLRQVRGPCEVFVSSGNISVDGVPSGPWSLHSNSGEVSIRITDQPHFELKAQVVSGGIRNTLPIATMGTASNNLLVGSIGGGGPLVDLSANSGAISIQ